MAQFAAANGPTAIYIYIYTYADELMGGTHFAHLRVKQRDALLLDNGTRPVSL